MKFRIGIIIAVVCVFVGYAAIKYCTQSKKETSICAKALLNCRQGSTDAEINAALRVLDVDSSPFILELANHLSAKDQASHRFQGSYMEVDVETGVSRPHNPTIGDVVFDIITRKLEGVPPGEFIPIRVLTHNNVTEWVAARKHNTLKQMRLEVAEQLLAKSEADHRTKPDDYSQRSVEYFRENLEIIRKGYPPRRSSQLEDSTTLGK